MKIIKNAEFIKSETDFYSILDKILNDERIEKVEE